MIIVEGVVEDTMMEVSDNVWVLLWGFDTLSRFPSLHLFLPSQDILAAVAMEDINFDYYGKFSWEYFGFPSPIRLRCVRFGAGGYRVAAT
jgi:hypothetical protein